MFDLVDDCIMQVLEGEKPRVTVSRYFVDEAISNFKSVWHKYIEFKGVTHTNVWLDITGEYAIMEDTGILIRTMMKVEPSGRVVALSEPALYKFDAYPDAMAAAQRELDNLKKGLRVK